MARDERGIIQQIFADTGDVAEPTFDFAEGWPVAYAQAGGQTPEREVFNRLFQRLYALGYDVTRYGGGLPWDATINYAVLALVMGADGELYFGKRASGPDVEGGAVDPTADDGSCWEPMRKNASEFELAIDNGNVAWELSAAPQAVLTLTTDATIAAPTNMQAGGVYTTRVVQDATGGRSLTWAAAYVGDIPDMPTDTGAVQVYRWYCNGTQLISLAADLDGVLRTDDIGSSVLAPDGDGSGLTGLYDGTVSLMSTRTTTGTWTITGLTVGKPLILIYKSSAAVTSGVYATMIAVSGVIGVNAIVAFGNPSGTLRSMSGTLIPTSDEVVLNVSAITSTITLYAYQ